MSRGMLRALARSLLFQASWNYDLMVALGNAYTIEPMLRDLPGGVGGKRYAQAMRRATQFFNAHPYMAGMAVGAVARVEYDGLPSETIRRLRHALIGPLGSVGDRLIWAGVLPAAAGLGLAVAARLSPLLGAAVFLVAYNAVHLVIRWWALRAGWERGTDVSKALTAAGLQRGLRVVGPLAAIAVGLALPLLAEGLTQDFAARTQFSIGLVAGLGIALQRWIFPTLGGLRFGLAAAGFALVLGLLW